MKKVVAFVMAVSVLFLSGCSSLGRTRYTKHANSFFDTFNTLVQMVAYTESQEEFTRYFAYAHQRFKELHQLFDIYNTYEGINNIKTINDNAGIQPVLVEQEIIDLLLFSKKWHETSHKTNIALGALLEIWHVYRMAGIDDPQRAELPPLLLLEEAAGHTDINQIIIDTKDRTVYLADPNMKLDVGGVAKGYATELVTQELIHMGMLSGVISAGGNIRTIGKPLDGKRDLWSIGIQDPGNTKNTQDGILDVVYVRDVSVVSSGDYQRYYTVNEKIYHHIIDPDTLFPGDYYLGVTVITKDSAVADFLSTALFLLPFTQAYDLAVRLDDVEALWVMPDGTIKTTPGMTNILKSKGAKNTAGN